MTPGAFRNLALTFPGVQENAHLGVPDFRVGGKIFAASGANGRAVVKLTLEEQGLLTTVEPEVFAPSPDAWGQKGWTHIILVHANEAMVQDALERSYRNVTARKRRR